LRRIFQAPYSDVRLLGATVTRRRAWPLIGLAAHLANGALFGLAFVRLGGEGWKRAIVAAELENALWPAMALVDRYHPDRRSGAWPPLLRNGRVFGYEVATHALFGAVLGLGLEVEPHRGTGFRSRPRTHLRRARRRRTILSSRAMCVGEEAAAIPLSLPSNTLSEVEGTT
jgi:hypothetical protein